MQRYLIASACFMILTAAPAYGQQRPTFSIDFQGPTIGTPSGCGVAAVISEGDILTTNPPGAPGPNAAALGPLPGPCIMVGAVGPGTVAAAPGLTIIGSPPYHELDALSYGRDTGDTLYFSVDEFALGVPTGPPDVFSEGIAGFSEASADVFVYAGPVAPAPPPAVIGNSDWNDGNGVAAPAPALPGFGLIEPNPPVPGSAVDVGDNLDAVDMDTRLSDFPGPIFFSLDASFIDPVEGFPMNTGTALGNGFLPGDVLVKTVAGAPVPAIALSCPSITLGLDLFGAGTDDLDALIFNDADGSLTCTPGDTLLFSVRRASAVIGVPDSCFGVPIEEGDILTFPTGAGLPPCLFISAEALGLATIRSGTNGPFGSDELDALDIVTEEIVPPVPSIPTWLLAPLAALLLGSGVVVLQPRRQNTV